MTSEERHDLKTNSLAAAIVDAPSLWQRHGNKVLLVIAAAALIFAGVRYKHSQDAQQDESARVSLMNAWAAVDQLRTQQVAAIVQPADFAKTRDEMEQTANLSVEDVIANSDRAKHPTRLAHAWLARGELYWTLANLPIIPSAATQPSTQSSTLASTQPSLSPKQSPAEYLKLASAAYGTVVNDFSNETQPAMSARLSLAAIAETTGDTAAASAHYKAVIESDKASAIYKSLAQQRITKLDDIARPMLLLPATQPATQPG